MFANPLKRCFKRDINPMNDDLKWSFKGNLRVYIWKFNLQKKSNLPLDSKLRFALWSKSSTVNFFSFSIGLAKYWTKGLEVNCWGTYKRNGMWRNPSSALCSINFRLADQNWSNLSKIHSWNKYIFNEIHNRYHVRAQAKAVCGLALASKPLYDSCASKHLLLLSCASNGTQQHLCNKTDLILRVETCKLVKDLYLDGHLRILLSGYLSKWTVICQGNSEFVTNRS